MSNLPAAQAGDVAKTPRPRGLPYRLLAAVFVPAFVAYLALLRNVEGFRFAHPFALALIPGAIALVLWVTFRRSADREPALRYSRAAELVRMRRGLVARLQDLPVVLRILTIVLVAVALARPQSWRAGGDLELEGIDIVISLDVSGSMEETDLVPNRMHAAKMVIERFVRQRPNDRLGLVVFGREAYTHVPLTLDHGTFLRMLSEVQVGLIDGRGTAIGNGIGVALNRLRRSEAKSKVVILLTDGESNAGNISPVQAARYAQAMGVKVYTIMAGDSGADPAAPGGARNVPPDVQLGLRKRQPVNPKLLEEIASMTGGLPFMATDTQALVRTFQTILEDLEKSRLHDRAVLYAELYPRFLWPALFAFLLELGLRLTRWRRLP